MQCYIISSFAQIESLNKKQFSYISYRDHFKPEYGKHKQNKDAELSNTNAVILYR